MGPVTVCKYYKTLCKSLLTFLSPAVICVMSGVKESSVCSSTKYLSIVTNTALEKDGLERERERVQAKGFRATIVTIHFVNKALHQVKKEKRRYDE